MHNHPIHQADPTLLVEPLREYFQCISAYSIPLTFNKIKEWPERFMEFKFCIIVLSRFKITSQMLNDKNLRQ